MDAIWGLQEAKNRFSEVVDRALDTGPQVVTRRGKKVVLVVSVETFRRLLTKNQPLSAFLRDSPLTGEDLDFDRGFDPGREVDL